MDGELQRTLSELCADLFSVAALEDCNAILQSLALLAEAFPQAQTLLGRLLNQKEELRVRPRSGPTSKLSVLSRSFLYQKETARSAVSLLAALASDSIRNQRRIVQSVIGVKLTHDPSSSGNSHQSTRASSHALYALTVPAAVTNTYRQWRKRQRELRGCRLPNGLPPTRDGVPMPCNCDECLGAEQLLSTWQQHFHDLSRWTRGLEGGGQSEDKRSAEDSVPLSSEDFLRVFLADFHMLTCTVGRAISEREEASSPYTSASHKNPGLIYYFVSPEEATATPSATPPHFDPLHHLSAIAIAAEIDVSGERRARVEPESDVIHDEDSLSTPLNPQDFSVQEVLLFSGSADIGVCVVHAAGIPTDDEASPFPLSDPNENLLADFVRLCDRYGGLVRCDQLMEHVSDDSTQFHAAHLRHVLVHILSYCHGEDLFPLCAWRRWFCQSSAAKQTRDEESMSPQAEPFEAVSPRWECSIVMTAKLPARVLQLDCLPIATAITRSPHRSFSVQIPQHELTGASDTDVNTSLSLLRISDEALAMLLPRCCICLCGTLDSHPMADSAIYLQPSSSPEVLQAPALETSDKIGAPVKTGGSLDQDTTVQLPLPGLSYQAKQILDRLEAEVSMEKAATFSTEGIRMIIEKLAKVIANCNERISFLSMATDQDRTRVAPEAHRAAAIARCRHCRDLLIQLGKKLTLQTKSLNPSARISQKRFTHVQKTLRSSISSTLIHSHSFDPWETPDVRVEKLHLSHREWASGFPDAAFYQETEGRQLENRRTQLQLSRKLMLQQQQKAKAQTRAKQDG